MKKLIAVLVLLSVFVGGVAYGKYQSSLQSQLAHLVGSCTSEAVWMMEINDAEINCITPMHVSGTTWNGGTINVSSPAFCQ